MKYKNEIFKGNDEKYYFRIIDNNGNVLLKSQGYTSKYGARKGLKSVLFNISVANNIKRKQSRSGKYYFNVIAGNGETVATSPIFSSKTRREGVIKVVSV